jgi:hypothetical protein
MSCQNVRYFHGLRGVRSCRGPSFRNATSVATPEELPSFHEWDQASLSLHRISLTFRTVTYRLALLFPEGTDEVGLSPVNVVSHFIQVTPPVTLIVHTPYPSTDV